jgi:hypothetical protein
MTRRDEGSGRGSSRPPSGKGTRPGPGQGSGQGSGQGPGQGPGRERDLAGELREQAERAFRREQAGRSAPELVVRGILQRAQVEMRPLVLVADDGTTWELLFPPGWQVEVEEGARVTVRGDRATDVATTTMVGPVLRVRSLSADRD